MKILAIDTSGASMSAAALDGGRLICEIFEHTGFTHSQRLMPVVERALDTAGWTVNDIERLAAIVGPGSFTGVRIGVSTARAMAQARDIPCVGVDALGALAADAMLSGYKGLICPMIDARAGQVYAAAFESSGGRSGLTRLTQDMACPLDWFLDMAHSHISEQFEGALFTGDASERLWDRIISRLGGRADRVGAARRMPRASAAGFLAQEKEAGAYSLLLPLYLREPQAERERKSLERTS